MNGHSRHYNLKRKKKTCLISNLNKKPIEIIMGLENPFDCSWKASNFDNDGTQLHVNLDMTLNDENAVLIRQIDDWLIAYTIKNKNILFSNGKNKLMHNYLQGKKEFQIYATNEIQFKKNPLLG